jgi:high-affinity iron transporter
VFANFLIGLREGLEAALIVAILVAYVVRIDQRQLLPKLWAGVVAALVLSIGAGAILTFTSATLSDEGAELFAGVTSLVAVGLITWMIFWMARNARAIKAHLHGSVDKAVMRSGWALAVVAFFAVLREGLETALFLWAGMESSGQTVEPVIGGLLGIGVAVFLGYLLYAGALRINLSTLFFWTGILLIIIAAGVLRYAVHELQEVGVLPGVDEYVFDVTGVLAPDSVIATFIRALFNLTPAMTALELIAWAGFIAITLPLFIRTVRKSGPRPSVSSAPPVQVPAG